MHDVGEPRAVAGDGVAAADVLNLFPDSLHGRADADVADQGGFPGTCFSSRPMAPLLLPEGGARSRRSAKPFDGEMRRLARAS